MPAGSTAAADPKEKEKVPGKQSPWRRRQQATESTQKPCACRKSLLRRGLLMSPTRKSQLKEWLEEAESLKSKCQLCTLLVVMRAPFAAERAGVSTDESTGPGSKLTEAPVSTKKLMPEA